MSVNVDNTSVTSALDNLLQHHLSLEPREDENQETNVRKRTLSQPPMKFGLQKNKTIAGKSTIESDNKRRPAIQKRSSNKYEPPLPDPPDPNSEAKSVTLHRMQNSLQQWDQQLGKILNKKERNDCIYKQELEQRDAKIRDLSAKYSTEVQLRMKIETGRNRLTKDLNTTQEELVHSRAEVEELRSELGQYQAAYQESEYKKAELENEVSFTAEQLQKSEGMRRRLNDQVTELQGQLAIEEQRSRFCVII